MKVVVKAESFRTHLTSLNHTNDMIRVTIDMPMKEYYKFVEDLNKETKK
jgi:hypothetical protein